MVRIAFVMEQGLGHTTYYGRMQQAVAAAADIDPVWLPIVFDGRDPLAHVPKLRRDIVLRGGLQGYVKLRRALRQGRLDAIFFHTQMPSVFCHALMARIPSLISLDSTPRQLLRMGAWYAISTDPNSPLEQRRHRWYARAFDLCRCAVPWSDWAAQSLIEEYGLSPDRVQTFRPGVSLTDWTPGDKAEAGAEVRLLFVGGQFKRKGGDLLLRWMQSAPAHVFLDIVTHDPVNAQPRVRIHSDLNAQDPRLKTLYQNADIFVLPTRADCYGLVVVEALAAGLPVVSTRVGAIPELVDHEKTGLLIAPDNYPALADALDCLAASPQRRQAMGRAAREGAEARFDGPRTLAHQLDLLRTIAAEGRLN